MIEKIEDPQKVAFLFEGWEETMIWSCLQKVMGDIYVRSGEKISAAKAVLGDFCFFAGNVDRELIEHEMERPGGVTVLVPQNLEWENAIKEEGEKRTGKVQWRRELRYALKKEPNVFTEEKLKEAVKSLRAPFILKKLEKDEFTYSKENGWCHDWTSQFLDYAQYEEMGLGYVIYDGITIVAGASSYTRYRDGIEIQIDTRKEYRNQGLAYACAAKLILECRKRGWYASWDAHNEKSLSLAQKLGYHFSHKYSVFVKYENNRA